MKEMYLVMYCMDRVQNIVGVTDDINKARCEFDKCKEKVLRHAEIYELEKKYDDEWLYSFSDSTGKRNAYISIDKVKVL